MKKQKINRTQFKYFLHQTSVELVAIYHGEIEYMLKLFYRDTSDKIKCDIKISEALLIPEYSFHITLVSNGELVDIFDFFDPCYDHLLLFHYILSVESLFQLNVLTVLNFVVPEDIERLLAFADKLGVSTDEN